MTNKINLLLNENKQNHLIKNNFFNKEKLSEEKMYFILYIYT